MWLIVVSGRINTSRQSSKQASKRKTGSMDNLPRQVMNEIPDLSKVGR